MRVSEWKNSDFLIHLIVWFMGVFMAVILINAIFPRPLIFAIKCLIYIPAGLILIYGLLKEFIDDIWKKNTGNGLKKR